MVIASLPSPSRGVHYLGPLPLHAYGLALAVGILVAARVAERRWVARGHPATKFGDLMMWVVVAGIVGARLYHVVSDFQLFTGDPWKIVAIWQGGLSIWGAVAGGAGAVAVLARRRNLDAGDLVDSIAPAVAACVGRYTAACSPARLDGVGSSIWVGAVAPRGRWERTIAIDRTAR